MPEHEMTEAERKALSAANRLLNNYVRDKFGSHSNRNDYIYWEAPDQRLFCYTPWKDSDGNYWTWVMKPFGRGSRSGKATRWKRVGKQVRSRSRKTARKRALTRYNNWLQYLAENDRRHADYQDWLNQQGRGGE